MKYILTVIALFWYGFTSAQAVNLKDFPGGSADAQFAAALSQIKNKYSARKQHATLKIPAGTYSITKPINLNKYISLEGEAPGTTVIQVKSTQHEAIVLEDNKSETDIYNHYNSIRNLTIYGPDYGKNPFEWKNLTLNNPRSVGIKILGLRNRIDNCTIDGFLWAGIEVSSSYYNFITNSFIKNNRVGIQIGKTSTSTYVNNSEIRNNSSGIIIEGNSYANFINNNMIENNITHMLPPARNEDDASAYKIGDGIVINGATNNFIHNNYFEQHFNNVVLNNAEGNEVTGNFFAVNNLQNRKQNIINISGNSANNRITGNKTMGAAESIDTLRIVLEGSKDNSTNLIDFGVEKNKILKKSVTSQKLSTSPIIP
ncbi:glycosyl hydrolase family 28-related protein [Kaistella pullorum]|uniref:Right-handed parallel beta-helix repeat-containing protein n=1 Tax=Kaistella pullorum TaxID=2763074 RepID=A0ABR8WP80_9FLAO|nr:right-handed parallel beta-helix repeat-containing protein [Kaistella pullorum]MBD8018753.1 right-handed parallel beta-helix repeat-containing protein [Kaistella pullorum]